MRCIYIECSPVDDSGHIHVRSSTDNVLLAKPLTAVQLKIKNHFVIYQCINDQKLSLKQWAMTSTICCYCMTFGFSTVVICNYYIQIEASSMARNCLL